MKPLELIFTYGLSGSGKTTWAKEEMRVNPGKYKRINKDDLRMMLDCGKFSKGNENFVLVVRDLLILEAFKNGYSVIIDDTNLHPKHVERFEELREMAAALLEKSVIVKKRDFTDVPIKECILRDIKRAASVGKDVIMDQYRKYLQPKPQKYVPPSGKPFCWIFDIDGTIAEIGERSPFDWNKVDLDSVNPSVKRLIDMINEHDSILVVSGRDSVCREKTMEWLTKNGISYDRLFMRPEGDTRKDYIVKKEIFENEIRDNWNVRGVFDDRLQVCRLWHELGIPLFRVGDPDADF